MRNVFVPLISIITTCVAYCLPAKADDNILQTQQVGSWTNVVSFAINHNGNYIIMTMKDESTGKDFVYESALDGSNWSTPKKVESLNSIVENGAQIGGVSLSYDQKTLFFHSDMPGGKGGFDIYSCPKTADGWGTPVNLEKINSDKDDTFPTVVPGGERIYFLRHQIQADARQEKKELDRMSIYYADKNAAGEFKRPSITNPALNRGWVEDVVVAKNSKSIIYSSRTDKKEPSRLLYSQIMVGEQVYIPEIIVNANDSYDYYQGQEADGKVYFLRSNNKKRSRVGSIFSAKVPSRFNIKGTVEEKGSVTVGKDSRPVAANITVYNPTTMQVLGRYNSFHATGEYDMVNNDHSQYMIDVRSPGYSYASYMIDYPEDAKSKLPSQIELFDTIALTISVYDAEIFRPLDSKVIAVRAADKQIFRSIATEDGHYTFRLPLGSNYNIIATSKNFEENKFMFRLEGDIVFSHFLRELPLSPLKRKVNFRIVNAETNEPILAHIRLKNTSRDENINVPAAAAKLPATEIALREGDYYILTVDEAKGYAFHSSMVDMIKFKESEITIPLIPLKVGERINLKDINFETASAELLPESYTELNRLLKLINENPTLRFEISAHTDDVGSASYNIRLSNMRALSVTNYLLENGVNPNRLVSKGYGMTQPKVPNTSDENRAINRRVDFMLLPAEEL